uniref:Uncharacterized protein n=1 Tax=Lepeophtheirus salmonis TaxID=72036 RepID=A0A0K2SWY9_LEPSM
MYSLKGFKVSQCVLLAVLAILLIVPSSQGDEDNETTQYPVFTFKRIQTIEEAPSASLIGDPIVSKSTYVTSTTIATIITSPTTSTTTYTTTSTTSTTSRPIYQPDAPVHSLNGEIVQVTERPSTTPAPRTTTRSTTTYTTSVIPR